MSKNPLPAAIYIFVIFVTTTTTTKTYFFLQIYSVSKVHFQTELGAEDNFELEDVWSAA